MTREDLIKEFEKNKNLEYSQKQKKYLRDKFEFLGISKEIRSKLEKEYILSLNNKSAADLIKEITLLHNCEFREYMYTGQSIALKYFKKLEYKHIKKMMQLTLINSWWENTDGYNAIIKRWLSINQEYLVHFISDYYKSTNIWIRRESIICQLGFKEKTNFDELKRVILYNIKDKEFFIQKAIGWSLRDYSKTNPQLVLEFITKHKDSLSRLAIREGSKYI